MAAAGSAITIYGNTYLLLASHNRLNKTSPIRTNPKKYPIPVFYALPDKYNKIILQYK